MTGPNEKVILAGEKERQGDYVFTATQSGEYRACFDNSISTFAEKLVDFEIAVCLPHSIARRVGVSYAYPILRLRSNNTGILTLSRLRTK